MGITPLAPGDPDRIARYRLYGRLGAGGQGVVYQGHADDTGLVAVKALHAAWLADPRARERLAKEVAAAGRVAPFCTARVLESDLDVEQPYVVSEFIPGRSLTEQVHEGGPLTGTPLDRLAVGTMTALLAIHEAGLVHRDVKPSNVILGPDGPRVVDFGIARDLAGEVTGTGSVLGTPAFMAPEQVDGKPLAAAADIFSWAVMMVFASTGRSPFEADNVSAVLYRVVSAPVDLSGVPPQLGAVLQRCLGKDPAGRPSAQEVLLQLIGRPVAAATGPWTVATPAPDSTQELLARAATLVHDPSPRTLVANGAPLPAGHPVGGGGQPPGAAGGPARPGPGFGPPPGGAVPAAPAGAGPDGAARKGGAGAGRRWQAALAVVGLVSLLASGGIVAWSQLSTSTGSKAPTVVGKGPVVPAEFAGVWAGGLSSGSRNYVTQLWLTQGATTGEESIDDCWVVLTLTKVSSDRRSLTFVAVPTFDPHSICNDPGELTMRRPAPSSDGKEVANQPYGLELVGLRNPIGTTSGSIARTG